MIVIDAIYDSAVIWFDDPPPYVSRTYLHEPVLCHGHELTVPLLEIEISEFRPQGAIDTCYLCLEPLCEPIEMDHVLPRSKGGEDGLLMPVHADCNQRKSNRPLL